MSDRKILNDFEVENVVGGLFKWNKSDMIMTYEHSDGSVTTHKILNYDKAWELSNEMHGKNYREDDILKALKNKGYVK